MLNNINNIIIVFILLNIILFCINKYFNKLHYYYNQLFSYIIYIDYYKDRYILSKKCSKPINDYKLMLKCVLQLLDNFYSMYPNKQFEFVIVFWEIDNKTNKPKVLLSDPYIINYNINNPICVNKLFNLIKFNTFTYNNNLNKIVVSIRKL